MSAQAPFLMRSSAESIHRRGVEVIRIEADALSLLAETLDDSFVEACEAIMASRGRVVITGMGKSGHIGRKWAATMSATGTPAMYVHPAEAAHGDLGMLIPGDILVVISNSGNTTELRAFLRYAETIGVKVIGVASRRNSLGHAERRHRDLSSRDARGLPGQHRSDDIDHAPACSRRRPCDGVDGHARLLDRRDEGASSRRLARASPDAGARDHAWRGQPPARRTIRHDAPRYLDDDVDGVRDCRRRSIARVALSVRSPTATFVVISRNSAQPLPKRS